jgi:hypothetical protein
MALAHWHTHNGMGMAPLPYFYKGVYFMILKYVGSDDYRDNKLRFIALNGDRIDFSEAEAEALLKAGQFEKEVEDIGDSG